MLPNAMKLAVTASVPLATCWLKKRSGIRSCSAIRPRSGLGPRNTVWISTGCRLSILRPLTTA
jgi:hypothetical protein